MFVDVGSGFGQECERLINNVPSLVGRVIAQDLQSVIEKAPDIEGVEKMVYDYFGEQVVKGRRGQYASAL